jgi:3-deoxy-D-manno-octulosonic-acid transferase
MLFVYRFLTIFLYPLFILIIYLRKFLKKEDKLRYKEKIFSTKFSTKKKNKKLIWFHGASIGEVQSIFPLIEILDSKNDYNFLITTTTLSAGNLIGKKFRKSLNIQHRYFPLETEFLIRSFLNFWRPNLVLFIDSEIWPNLILELKKRKIRTALINGRITKKTFKRWMLISSIAKKIFNAFDLCLASSKQSKKYLKELNVKNLKHVGNLKLTGSININLINNKNSKILFKKKNWCAVSTHPSEEIFCLKTHILLKKTYDDLITIIIPRHINRSNKIKKICDKFNLNSQVLNDGDLILKKKEVIIVNSFGVVPKFLKYSRSVFMGKSIDKKFKNIGGQNPIEAAKLGCKVYHGPFVDNFKEVYQFLNLHKISRKVNNEKDLSKELIIDFRNPKINKNKKIKIVNDLGKKILQKSINEINKISL